MNPVTGPIVTEISTPDLYDLRRRYQQARPYNLALPYRRTVKSVKTKRGSVFSAAAFGPGTDLIANSGSWVDLENALYQKLLHKRNDRIEGLVFLAETRKSVQMIAARATQFRRFITALRRFDFVLAADTLRIPRDWPLRVSRKKAVASNFLEYKYGWMPLIKDIHTGMDLLLKPSLPKTKVRAVIRDGFSGIRLVNPATHSVNPYAIGWDNPAEWHEEHTWAYNRLITGGYSVTVSNPNAYLANQWGLVNLAATAWELVTLSFVVDWFVNIGEVLSAMTDNIGLTVTAPWTSHFVVGTLHYYCRIKHRIWDGSQYVLVDTRDDYEDGTFSDLARSATLTGPQLSFTRLEKMNLGRALSAIALVTQRLRS